MSSGYGQVGFGRCEFGQAKSDVEPRFESSLPTDGGSGVSIYQVFTRTVLYNFSSRIQEDNTLKVRVSEDGGSLYNDAYASGAFVAPYNGSNSKLMWIDSQRLLVAVEKTAPWTDNQTVMFEVTAFDEYGQGATKTTPIVWD